MVRSLLSVAAIAVALSVSAAPSFAQSGSSCAAAAARANDNINLRVQQNTPGAENRESARLHVTMASQAAAAGREQECWQQLNTSALFVGLPAGTMPSQTGIASGSGSVQSGGVQSGGN